MTPVEVGTAEGVVRVVYTLDTCTDLPALVYPDGTVMTEWELTEDERLRIGRGENIRLWLRSSGIVPPLTIEVTSEDRV